MEFTRRPGSDGIAGVPGAQRHRLGLWRAPLFFAGITVAVIAGMRVLAPGAADTAGGGSVSVLGTLVGGVFDRRRRLRKATAHARAQGEWTVRVDDDGMGSMGPLPKRNAAARRQRCPAGRCSARAAWMRSRSAS
ncbi:hypothetical protein ACIF70_32245 [Actinacidiphila glaucinigra]|uniref:hypothetical protein n=1 Tax=Actinacidiphila glaucinigra TaxID=235986 RepID=UPI002DD8C828|nr:hypothetical protein [Actinacidiphila glaucinigra]WSD64363.1 hypothetical protein OIE69_38480 [Actinacidiphila glaucinigra]